MRKSYQSMLGVTLLEIMLVLAIAALIIVMSIRFYQSASNSSKVNAAMSTLQAIVAAEETYYNANAAWDTASKVAGYLPGGVMPQSPWTGTTSTGAGTAPAVYTITIPGAPGAGTASSPTGACGQLSALVKQNTKFTSPTCSNPGFTVSVVP